MIAIRLLALIVVTYLLCAYGGQFLAQNAANPLQALGAFMVQYAIQLTIAVLLIYILRVF